ncbi:MAG: PAS domain S-box protein, partial [Thermodesulfovibrionales bacterium]|nr:PAS domain S-box protein [Thermodesulfovibrionales bacterium]
TMLLDRIGTVVAHTNFQLVQEQLNMSIFDFVKAAFKEKEGNYNYPQEGLRWLASVSSVPKTGWLVIYNQPFEVAMSPINQIKTLLTIGFILAVLFATFLSIILSKRLTEPFVNLIKKTKLLSEGNYDSSLPIESFKYSEVYDLAENFNKMTDAIRNREEALSFAKFAIDNTSEAVCWLDSEGRLLYTNDSFCNLIGTKREDILNKLIYDLPIDYSKDEFLRTSEKLKQKKYSYSEKFLKRLDGSLYPAEIAATLLNYEGQEYIFIFLRDISERKRAEKALFEEKELLSVTLRSIGEGVISTDIKGKILLMNKMAEKLSGWSLEEAYKSPVYQILKIVDFNSKGYSEDILTYIYNESKEDSFSYSGKYKLIDRDKNQKPILFNISPVKDEESKVIGAVLTFKDITDLVRLEEEILKSEKLEAIGILAGGIAHDFNNLLTGVLGNIQLAKIHLGTEHPAYKRIEAAEKAIDRSISLTHQLLTFSKGGAPLKKPSSIEQIIKDSAIFSLRGTNIKCEFDFSEDLLPVEVDEGQLSRVISNLVINAVQAMPFGGTININIKNVEVRRANNLPIKDGQYVLIEIRDQGIGIPEENLGKIFDPFFTTKEGGSGLGLAVVYSIIKNHGGHIQVSSKVNEGTTFQIYLPSIKVKSQSLKKTEEDDSFIRGKGKILVMDDEEIIRDLAREILNHLGYECFLCKDGKEAFEIYKEAKEKGDPFDAVIMDLTIPGGMGGKELMSQLLQYDPKVKAIVSSGYSSNPVMALYRDFGFAGVIRKPFRIKEFSEVLHQVLNVSE